MPTRNSIKFYMMTEDQVDVCYQRKGNMEWDIAAGMAIVKAAGEMVLDRCRRNLRCNKPKFVNGPYLCLRPEECVRN